MPSVPRHPSWESLLSSILLLINEANILVEVTSQKDSKTILFKTQIFERENRLTKSYGNCVENP